MYMSKCMYNGIYIYVCGEGGLRSEKIWGVTVDKWEGMIGFFEGANKLVLIEAAIGRRPCPPQHRPFLNINVNICNMHVESCNMHVDV